MNTLPGARLMTAPRIPLFRPRNAQRTKPGWGQNAISRRTVAVL